jgi:hypothetical protein
VESGSILGAASTSLSRTPASEMGPTRMWRLGDENAPFTPVLNIQDTDRPPLAWPGPQLGNRRASPEPPRRCPVVLG